MDDGEGLAEELEEVPDDEGDADGVPLGLLELLALGLPELGAGLSLGLTDLPGVGDVRTEAVALGEGGARPALGLRCRCALSLVVRG
jgi:hypothetical protein